MTTVYAGEVSENGFFTPPGVVTVKSRPRIGLDIDGVMYRWVKTAMYMLREILPNSPYKRLGGPLRDEEQSTYWDYIENNVSGTHWRWLWTEGVRLGLFRYGHLHSGTIKAVRELAEIGDVILLTNRKAKAVEDTLAWVSYLKLPIMGIHFVPKKLGKSSVLPHCDAYLDDNVDNCVELSRNTAARIIKLMDRPWNRGETQVQEERVYSWDEFVREVRAL